MMHNLTNNIQRTAQHVAPKLAAAAKQLERNMIADRLSEQLHDREDVAALRRQHVLHGNQQLICKESRELTNFANEDVVNEMLIL